MTLIGLQGSHKAVNWILLQQAFQEQPSLIIDCANCANPHRVMQHADQFHDTYVMEVELIYTFRDVLKQIDTFASQKGIKRVVITTPRGLFNYQDTEENKNIFEHAWILIAKLSTKYEVVIGIVQDQEALAKKYCDVIWDIPSGVNELPLISFERN